MDERFGGARGVSPAQLSTSEAAEMTTSPVFVTIDFHANLKI